MDNINNEEQKQKKQRKLTLRWRFPKRKRKYKTIDVEYPKGWSNCGVSISNYFIADTNDGSNWDTLRFPLPKPKHKWQIKCYGGTIGRKNNKQFVILIDKP